MIGAARVPPHSDTLGRAARAGLALAIALVMGAVGARAQGPTRSEDAPVRVYGIEIGAREQRERVLIFCDGELEGSVEIPASGTLRLRLAGSVLADSAPREVTPAVEGAIRSVRARELQIEGRQIVEVEVSYAEGLEPQVSNQGAIVAIAFPRFVRPDDRGFALHFDNEAIAEVVETLARETGERFVFDDRLRGTITIIAPDRVNQREALALLDAALFMRGFAAVGGPEDTKKIIPIAEAITAAPWDPDAPSAEREAPVTTMVRLERADLDEVLRILAPAVGSTGLAVPLYSSRAVLLAGNEAQLHRWVSLAQALDRADTDEVRVLRLRERPAGEVAALLGGLITGSSGAGTSPSVSIVVDERTNALVIRASEARYQEIRSWVETLDRTPAGSGEMRVIRLHHTDPEEIAEHLRALAAGGGGVGAGAQTPSDLDGLVVGVHEMTNSIVVRASPEGQELVELVVKALDLRPPQVAVEVTVMEIRVGEEQDLALNYFVTIGDPESNPSDVFGAISRIPEGGFPEIPAVDVDFAGRVRGEEVAIPITGPDGDPIDLMFPLHQVLVTAEHSDAQSRILMRPHFVAANGEEQEFFVGDVVPIPVQSDSQQEGSLTLESDIVRQDVGMELRVKPSIGQAGGVTLNLELDLSEVDRSVPSDLGVTLLQRRLRANAYLRDGEFALIGFANRSVEGFSVEGTPFLRDIPFLGWLFRSEGDALQRRYFVVAAQASVLRTADEQLAASIRARVALERSLARVGELGTTEAVRYAVLVATRTQAEQAENVARTLPLAEGEESQISGWQWEGRNRFDVMVTGYRTLAQAGRAVLRLGSTGYRPRVIAIPSPPDEGDGG